MNFLKSLNFNQNIVLSIDTPIVINLRTKINKSLLKVMIGSF